MLVVNCLGFMVFHTLGNFLSLRFSVLNNLWKTVIMSFNILSPLLLFLLRIQIKCMLDITLLSMFLNLFFIFLFAMSVSHV